MISNIFANYNQKLRRAREKKNYKIRAKYNTYHFMIFYSLSLDIHFQSYFFLKLNTMHNGYFYNL